MNRKQSLIDLFAQLFSAPGLRGFLEHRLAVPNAVMANLPGESAPLDDLCEVAADELAQHQLVSSALFEALSAEFPFRSGEIAAVAALWAQPPDNVAQHAEVTALPAYGMAERAPAEPAERYDVFIAHAGRDATRAHAMYMALEERGVKTFLDSEALRPGDRWTDVIPKALHSSRMTAVLVSRGSRDAHYLGEEIVLAVDLARDTDSSHRVVPIYLDGRPRDPEDKPYGLESVQAIDLRRRGLESTADELAELLGQMPTEDDHEAPETELAYLTDIYTSEIYLGLDRHFTVGRYARLGNTAGVHYVSAARRATPEPRTICGPVVEFL